MGEKKNVRELWMSNWL